MIEDEPVGYFYAVDTRSAQQIVDDEALGQLAVYMARKAGVIPMPDRDETDYPDELFEHLEGEEL